MPHATGRWRVTAASVRGPGHERTGQPCQDAHHWIVGPQDTLIAAVADGASSASLGQVGAALAARAAVEKLGAELLVRDLPEGDAAWRVVLLEALQAARVAVEAEAERHNAALHELATTLIVIVATGGRAAGAQIGDGAAVVGDHDGNFLTLTAPQRGEYINETSFLTSPGAIEAAQVSVWSGPRPRIAALSDGLQMVALDMPTASPHRPFFSPIFAFVDRATDEKDAHNQLTALLESPRIRRRTNDDLTLLLATLRD